MNLYQSLVTVEPLTFVAQVCNLLIQMLLVKIFLLDKVHAILDERRRLADEEITEAQKAKAEAAAIKSQYEENMAKAKEAADKLVQDATRTATLRGEKIVQEAQQQAAALKAQADADIAQQQKKALNDVKDEIGSIAMEIASKVVEREISEKDNADIIEAFLKNVGEAS